MKTKLKRLLALFMVVLFVVPTSIITAVPSNASTFYVTYSGGVIITPHQTNPTYRGTTFVDTCVNTFNGGYGLLPVVVSALNNQLIFNNIWICSFQNWTFKDVNNDRGINTNCTSAQAFVDGSYTMSPSSNWEVVRVNYRNGSNSLSLDNIYGSLTNPVLVTPSKPTSSAGTFVGWSTANTSSDGANIIITSNYGSGDYYAIDTSILYNNLNYTGYSGPKAPTTYKNLDLRLYAVFANLDLTFDAGAGVIDSSYSTTYQTPDYSSNHKTLTYKIAPNQKYKTVFAVTPTASRTGYNLSCWAYKGSPIFNGGLNDPGGDYSLSTSGTLDAVWETVDYSITFKNNGGSFKSGYSKPTNYNIESPDITLPTSSNITRAGYDFKGWYENSDFSGSKVTKINTGSTGNKTYYAKWTPKDYTVTLDKNASDATAGTGSVTATYNAAMPSGASAPTRTGYTFAGYYDTDASSGGTQYYNASMASTHVWDKTSATTLYARWTINSYTLTLDLATGLRAYLDSMADNAPYFEGTSGAYSHMTDGQFNQYGILWDDGDTSSSRTRTENYNTSIGTATSNRVTLTYNNDSYNYWAATDYYVTDWAIDFQGTPKYISSSNSFSLTSDITLIPQNYKAKNYTMTFDTTKGYIYSGGSIGSLQNSITDATINNDGEVFSSANEYAEWPYTYRSNHTNVDKTVYSLNPGNTVATWDNVHFNFRYKDMIKTIPSASRTGYTFKYWYYTGAIGNHAFTAGTCTDTERYAIHGNGTAYAVWEANSYNVTYSAGTGKTFASAVSPTSITFGSSGTLRSGEILSSDGNYRVVGWANTDGGAKAYDLGAAYTMNTEGKTLYAVWEEAAVTYTVRYNRSASYGVSGSTTTESKSSGTFTLPSDTPTYGYGYFWGWTTNRTNASNGTAAVYSGSLTYAQVEALATAAGVTTVDLYPVVGWTVDLAVGPECWAYKSDASYEGFVATRLYKFYGTDLDLPTTNAAIEAIDSFAMNMLSPYAVGASDQRSFMEWNTAADWENSHHGTGTSYWNKYTVNENVKLFAMWGYPIVFDADGGYFAHVINGEYVPIETTDTTQYNAGNGKYYLSRYETYVADYGRSDNIANNPTARYLYVIPDGVNTPVNEQYPVAPVKGDNTMWLVSGKPTYLLVNSDASSMQYYGKIGRATVETADLDLTIPVSGGNTARHSSLNLEWSQFRLISDSHGHTSVHFYAAWEPAVVYHANGGTGSLTDHLTYSGNVYLYEYNSYSVKTGDAAGITYTGKHVTEWKDADNNVVEVGASLGGARSNSNQIDLYAQWADNTYKVVWKNYDGTVLQTDTGVVYGTVPIYTESTPTKAQDAQYTYSFAGWDKTVVAVSGKHNSTITYTATFTETLRTYTITWVNEGGAVLETDENVEYGTTPSYDGTTPTKDSTAQYDYTFDAWTPTVSAVTGDATYTATFTQTARTYTVTLNVNSGTINAGNVTSYTYGVGATLPTNVTRDGYTFDGWFDNSAFTGTAVTAIGTTETGNKEFWAKWTEALDSNLKFTGANLTLYNDFAIRFRVAASDIDGKYENVYATFGFNGVDNAVTINLNEATLDKGYYVFKFEDIAPNMMGEPVIAQLHGTKGGVEKDGSIRYYAIADYCYNILGTEKYKSLHNLHTLLVDILNYGSSAEVYTNKHATHYFGGSKTRDYTEKTVNSIDEFASYSGLATKDAPDKSSVAYGGKTGSAGSASIDGKQPILGDTVAIRFYITGTAPEGSTVKFYIPDLDGSARVWIKPLGSKSGDYYTVLFDDFNASHMDNKICITVLDGNGNAISQTLEYSIATYYELMKNSTDVKVSGGGTLGALVTNMMKYGDSAKTYVASPNA